METKLYSPSHPMEFNDNLISKIIKKRNILFFVTVYFDCSRSWRGQSWASHRWSSQSQCIIPAE